MMKDNSFPIDWTSTQLEGAVPSLCESIGYDVPLSTKFSNEGAPRFIFSQNEMQIHYDMMVEVWDQEYRTRFLDLHFHELVIKFKMQLLSNMTLMVDWESIQLQEAHINSYVQLTHPDNSDI